MREILFRGKRVDNGEWVYGNLMGDSIIIPRNQIFEVEADCIYGCDLTAYVVDPATVGQYTGLMDKNGKKIWERDICTIPGSKKQGLPGVIRYWKPETRFLLSRSGYNNISLDNSEQWLEILGNTADNPELLQN